MKPDKFTGIAVFILFPLLWGITGCAVGLVGVGAGVGAITYVNGQLQKTYEVDYHEAVQASITTLNSLKIPVISTTADELETNIKAKRPDGTPVTIDVVRIGDALARVDVRTGTVGVWDKQVSEQIQDFIGKELIGDTSRNQVEVKPAKKKTAPRSSSRPADEKKSANELEPESSQKISQPAAENGPGKKERIKSKDQADATSENQDLIIYFQDNSNEIPIREVEKLNRAAEMLRRHPQSAVTLNGYADSSGNSEYNMLISESRANAVKLYLISKGINQDKITVVVGHGAAGAPPEGEEKPRGRVKIEIDKVQ